MTLYFVAGVLALFLPGFVISFLCFRFLKLNKNLNDLICISLLVIFFIILESFNGLAHVCPLNIIAYLIISLISITLGKALANKIKKMRNQKI